MSQCAARLEQGGSQRHGQVGCYVFVLRVQNFESDASERADGDTSGGFMNQSILSSEGFRDRIC